MCERYLPWGNERAVFGRAQEQIAREAGGWEKRGHCLFGRGRLNLGVLMVGLFTFARMAGSRLFEDR